MIHKTVLFYLTFRLPMIYKTVLFYLTLRLHHDPQDSAVQSYQSVRWFRDVMKV